MYTHTHTTTYFGLTFIMILAELSTFGIDSCLHWRNPNEKSGGGGMFRRSLRGIITVRQLRRLWSPPSVPWNIYQEELHTAGLWFLKQWEPETLRQPRDPEEICFVVIPSCAQVCVLGGGHHGKCKVHVCGVTPVVREPSARTRRDQRQSSDATVVLHFKFSRHSLTLISKVRRVDPNWSARIPQRKNIGKHKRFRFKVLQRRKIKTKTMVSMWCSEVPAWTQTTK